MRFAIAAIAVLAASPAYAQSDEARAACFTELPLTAALVAETGNYGYTGFAGDAGTPTFVVGHLSSTRNTEDAHEVFGAVLFIRDNAGAWRAMLPRAGESFVAAYANGQGGVFIATMWTDEGPGGEWMLVRSTDGLRTAACNEVRFPDELNQPVYNLEFLSLHDLDINARGRGEIIGDGSGEDHPNRWYVYRTRDHGATWSKPRRISRERLARAGIYTRITEEEGAEPTALVAELTAYAATR